MGHPGLGVSDNNRVPVGNICFKGPHLSWIGQEDHGVCGSKYFATIYLTVEDDYPNSRGESVSLDGIAAALRGIVANEEKLRFEKEWKEFGDG